MILILTLTQLVKFDFDYSGYCLDLRRPMNFDYDFQTIEFLKLTQLVTLTFRQTILTIHSANEY